LRLIPEWRVVLTKAWSIKLMALSCFLSAAEASMQFVQPHMLGWKFAVLNTCVVGAAMLARVLAQKDMGD